MHILNIGHQWSLENVKYGSTLLYKYIKFQIPLFAWDDQYQNLQHSTCKCSHQSEDVPTDPSFMFNVVFIGFLPFWRSVEQWTTEYRGTVLYFDQWSNGGQNVATWLGGIRTDTLKTSAFMEKPQRHITQKSIHCPIGPKYTTRGHGMH